MSVAIESLFTAALGLQAPWAVESVDLNTAKQRIDFEVRCNTKSLTQYCSDRQICCTILSSQRWSWAWHGRRRCWAPVLGCRII